MNKYALLNADFLSELKDLFSNPPFDLNRIKTIYNGDGFAEKSFIRDVLVNAMNNSSGLETKAEILGQQLVISDSFRVNINLKTWVESFGEGWAYRELKKYFIKANTNTTHQHLLKDYLQKALESGKPVSVTSSEIEHLFFLFKKTLGLSEKEWPVDIIKWETQKVSHSSGVEIIYPFKDAQFLVIYSNKRKIFLVRITEDSYRILDKNEC